LYPPNGMQADISIGQLDETTEAIKNKGMSDNGHEFNVYSYRWVVLAMYSIATVTNGMGFISFASIANTTRWAFGISEFMLVLSSMAGVVVYIPMALPASYIIERYGLRMAINAGVIITIIGAWMKVLIMEGFWLVILGQVIMSLAQPLIGNGITQVSNTWFAPAERAIATTVANIAAPAALIFAYLIPTAFVKNQDVNPHEAQVQIRNSLICQAAIIVGGGIFVLIFFRSKPPTPPSASSVKTEKFEFRSSLKGLFTNMNYIWMCIVYFTMCGNFNCVAALIGQFVGAYGFSNVTYY